MTQYIMAHSTVRRVIEPIVDGFAIWFLGTYREPRTGREMACCWACSEVEDETRTHARVTMLYEGMTLGESVECTLQLCPLKLDTWVGWEFSEHLISIDGRMFKEIATL